MGTFIQIVRSNVRRSLSLALLLGSPALFWAQTGSRSAIRLEQVVAALNAARVPLGGAQVTLLAQNTASTVEPRLEVRDLEPWGDRGARVRIECAAHEECLPFYVAVHWTDLALAHAALHTGRPEPASSPDNVSARETRLPDPVRAPALAARSEAVKPASNVETAVQEVAVHAGSRATLLIDEGRLHIKLPVICLEKGTPGNTIRVTALDHKQTYRAEVVDSTLLKGTL